MDQQEEMPDVDLPDARYRVSLASGSFAFREGDSGTEMFLISAGRVAILKTADGKGRVMAILGQGDFFGEAGILEDRPREVSARADTDCELVRIDRATFSQMVRINPEIPIRMLRKLSRRLTSMLVEGVTGGASLEYPAVPGSPPESPKDLTQPLPGGARLEHLPSERAFPLAIGESALIGRFDPITGSRPPIELTELDPERSTSRRHARIFSSGDSYSIVEEIGVANGTRVNGNLLAPEVPMELRDGDVILLGRVELVFRRG